MASTSMIGSFITSYNSWEDITPPSPVSIFKEKPPTDADVVNFTLHGVSETLMITLVARALDACEPVPFLGDTHAKDLVDRLRYSYHSAQASPGLGTMNLGILMRARLLDTWTTEFLSSYAKTGATILHLACGLDTRCLRVPWAKHAKIRWIDVDLPDVVALRHKLAIPTPDGDYRLIAASVTELRWLDDVPADRPTLVVMEGLAMYLRPEEVHDLFRRVCRRFKSGSIVFDNMGSLTVRMQAAIRPIARTGAELHFGMDDGRELESAVEGLKLREQRSIRQVEGFELYPWYVHSTMWLYSWFPYLRTFGSFLRYEF